MRFTIETASLADATKRAAIVAPNKGAAFDKAAGVVFEAKDGGLVIRSTDLETTFLQSLDVGLDEEGSAHLPSDVVSNLVQQFPVSTYTEIATQPDGSVTFSCVSTEVKLRQILNEAYPPFGSFTDKFEMSEVQDFSSAIAAVSWCSARSSTVLSGIHLTGSQVMASDGHAVAMHSLDIAIDEPITVPMSSISSILKRSGGVKVGAAPGRILVMPDDKTELSSLIYVDKFPDVSIFDKFINATNLSFEVSRESLSAVIGRMRVLCREDRLPTVSFSISDDVLTTYVDIPDLGEISDQIAIAPISDVGDYKCFFNPDLLTGVLQATKGEIMHCSFTRDPHHPWVFRDGEFTAVVVPVRKI